MGAKTSKSRPHQPVYGPDWRPERLPRDPRDVPEPQCSINLSDPNEDKNSDTSSVSTVSPSHYSPEYLSTVQNSPPLNTNPSQEHTSPTHYRQPKHQHPQGVLEPQRSTNLSDPNEDKNSNTSSVSKGSPSQYSHQYPSTVQNSPPLNTNPSQEYSYPIHYPQPAHNYSPYSYYRPHNYQLADYTRDYNAPGYSYHTHQPKKSDHNDTKRISDWLFNPDPSDYYFNSHSDGRLY